MPIVEDVYRNFIKRYGPDEGKSRYFAWENANPSAYKKGLKTARDRGDKILLHAPRKKSWKTNKYRHAKGVSTN
ncbi:MAG: hypothetical protein KGI08_03275 [Thaumarchaeota archaeon]|nr:hypothetical protein [Nitrososphaerota archaeon]